MRACRHWVCNCAIAAAAVTFEKAVLSLGVAPGFGGRDEAPPHAISNRSAHAFPIEEFDLVVRIRDSLLVQQPPRVGRPGSH
jgi:hypothetical protein